jgi:hypothetical protein
VASSGGYRHRQKSNTCTEALEEAGSKWSIQRKENCVIASLDELSEGSRLVGTEITGGGHTPDAGEVYLIQKVSRSRRLLKFSQGLAPRVGSEARHSSIAGLPRSTFSCLLPSIWRD